jgi:hypothetical protein
LKFRFENWKRKSKEGRKEEIEISSPVLIFLETPESCVNLLFFTTWFLFLKTVTVPIDR